MSTLDLSADVISVSDITDRVDELRDEVSGDDPQSPEETEAREEAQAELAALEAILADLQGYGGDHQWEGDWYPGSLIADRYFETYARELLVDCGDLPRDLPRYIEIDWAATAANVRTDYSSTEIDGETYWYR